MEKVPVSQDNTAVEELAELQEEQSQLVGGMEESQDNSKEETPVSQEAIEQRRQEIQQRIEEIQREIERRKTIASLFLEVHESMKQAGLTPKEIMQSLHDKNIMDALPKEVAQMIEENYQKFNFVDYDLVERMLDDTSLTDELEALTQEQEQLEAQTTVVEELPQQEVVQPIEVDETPESFEETTEADSSDTQDTV